MKLSKIRNVEQVQKLAFYLEQSSHTTLHVFIDFVVLSTENIVWISVSLKATI